MDKRDAHLYCALSFFLDAGISLSISLSLTHILCPTSVPLFTTAVLYLSAMSFPMTRSVRRLVGRLAWAGELLLPMFLDRSICFLIYKLIESFFLLM